MTTLRCPACEDDRVFLQSKAFVVQEVHLREDGSFDVDVYESEDVEFVDDKEWFTCRACGEHSESIDHFKYEEEA
jgi:hypothetical protein